MTTETIPAYDSDEDVAFWLSQIRLQIIRKVPYGTALWNKLVAQLALLLPPPGRPLRERVARNRRELQRSCQDTFQFLLEKVPGDLSWLDHRAVKDFITEQLAVIGYRYFMPPEELREWCESIFPYLRRTASQQVKRGEVSKEEQRMCVKAMYELVEMARTTSYRSLLMTYGDYLLRLCLKTACSPPGFYVTYPELLSTDANDKGCSALVYRGRMTNGSDVAIKSYKLYESTLATSRKTVRTFLREALTLHLLQHPNIIPFIGVVHEPRRLCIMTEWMIHGNINEYLRKVPTACRKELLEQVADGLHFMSEYNIIHGDLKGGNVLISAKGKACISDFGTASIQEDSVSNTQIQLPLREKRQVLEEWRKELRARGKPTSLASTISSRLSSSAFEGTWAWMAPERCVGDDSEAGNGTKATFASDVYSFAMLAFEIYSGEIPFQEQLRKRPNMFIPLMAWRGERPSRPKTIPDEVWNLVRLCWAQSPADRPRIIDVYNTLAGME